MPIPVALQLSSQLSLTAELIESKAFPFFRSLDSNSYEYTASWGGGQKMVDAIANGFRLGTILGKKLKVRGEEKDLIFTNLKENRLFLLMNSIFIIKVN